VRVFRIKMVKCKRVFVESVHSSLGTVKKNFSARRWAAVKYFVCVSSHPHALVLTNVENIFQVENADDVRLSATLLRTCMRDKKKFCNGV
jgi:hypothetical protein